MHILFYLGHPAHFHLFKNVINTLKKYYKISILTKKKDILDDLLNYAGINYTNILPEGRKSNMLGIALGMIKRDLKLFRYCLRERIGIMIGTSPEICHVGKLLNIPSINVNEDDASAVPLYAKLSYPFATEVLTPLCCDNDKWNDKSIKYNSYHELAYLHPKYFEPDETIVKKYGIDKPYFILRFSGLEAHHDKDISGISNELGIKIIKKLEQIGNIYITSERNLNSEFEKYKLLINPLDIHHILYFANMYIGDSQTMAAEAAVLGTPSLRFNDFVGKLGYLEELEYKYGLTHGINTSEPEKLLRKIDELLSNTNLKDEWQKKRQKMLSEKIDVTAFLVWFIENYPESSCIMKKNPNYQYNFR